MARIAGQKTPWEMYILGGILVTLGIVAVALVIGPTGSLKEATDKIKPQDKSKMEKKDVFKEVKTQVLKAKPRDRTWSQLNDSERERMVDRAYKVLVEMGHGKDVTRNDVVREVEDAWRGGMADEKELPSDDPAERWKQLTKGKFENIRTIDLKDETGFLNCPQVDVFEDAAKSVSAGQMNHDEWVLILEEEGAMSKVKRRKDQKEAWIESKWLKRVYTQEDIEKGPAPKKTSERDEDE